MDQFAGVSIIHERPTMQNVIHLPFSEVIMWKQANQAPEPAQKREVIPRLSEEQ